MNTRRWVGVVVLVALAGAGWFFREPLRAWFQVKPAPGHAAAGAADAGAEQHRFSRAGLDTLQLAYGSYEQLRQELARDSVARAPELAATLVTTTGEVSHKEPGLPPRLAKALGKAYAASEALAQEKDVAKARKLFGELSEGLVTVALEDPRVADGWHLFQCPMAEGYQRWIQSDPDMANPYMGTRMLKCGNRLDLKAEAEAVAQAVQEGDPDEVAYFTCPMHPSVRQATKGICPICGMDLTPVTKGDLATGVVTVDEVRRQKIGVKVEAVKKAPFVIEVRTVGEVKYDETKLEDVTLKVGGFIRGLEVSTQGEPVKKGQVLFRFYSPELFSAQQELLLALRTRGQDPADPLVKAARQRLRLWDVSDAQVEEIVKGGEPLEELPIRSPATGYVIEKEVVEGAAVQPGMKLFRIASLDRVWVEAQVYEAELSYVKVGLPVEVELPFVPGKKLAGRVSYVYPWLSEHSRTGQVRIELANPAGLLKPKMYANVVFRIDRGEKLQVPASAIIYTGPRRLVFVDLGEGRLRPREVKLGLRGPDVWEIVSGLEEGESVVTSGNFLIAAESRLRSATGYWGSEVQGEDGAGGGGASAPPGGAAPKGAGHVH